MSSPPFRDHIKEVAVFAQLKKGKWQTLSGGPLPSLKEGTIAELTIAEVCFKDDEDLRRYTQSGEIHLFPEGSIFYAAMHAKFVDKAKEGDGIPSEANSDLFYHPESFCFYPVQILEPLKLRYHGFKKPSLKDCKCSTPVIKNKTFGSLNQILTHLSIKLEKDRKSVGGSTFEHIWFVDEENDNIFRPLKAKRREAQATIAKRLESQGDDLFDLD